MLQEATSGMRKTTGYHTITMSAIGEYIQLPNNGDMNKGVLGAHLPNSSVDILLLGFLDLNRF